MQGSSFDKNADTPNVLRATLARSELTVKQRIVLLALNFIPLLHVAAVVGLALLPTLNPAWRLLAATAALYLAPPLCARLILALGQIEEGKIPAGSKAFFHWWALFQLQTIFNRLAFLDEALRIVPGAYSQWLRLWGARIGRLTFWSPGTAILDRPFISVGHDVVFGAGVRVNPHVVAKNNAGALELILGTVRIGDRAIIGGYSLLTAGSEVASDEAAKGLTVLPPYSSWKDGKRVRPGQAMERFDDEA